MKLTCKSCGTENLHIVKRYKFPESKEDFIVICCTCGEEYEIYNNIIEDGEPNGR